MTAFAASAGTSLTRLLRREGSVPRWMQSALWLSVVPMVAKLVAGTGMIVPIPIVVLVSRFLSHYRPSRIRRWDLHHVVFCLLYQYPQPVDGRYFVRDPDRQYDFPHADRGFYNGVPMYFGNISRIQIYQQTLAPYGGRLKIKPRISFLNRGLALIFSLSDVSFFI